MTDLELLEKSEELLKRAREAKDTKAVHTMLHASEAHSLLVIARNSMPVIIGVPEPQIDQEAFDKEFSRRVVEYTKYWNPETGKFEIDVGTDKEWICTEDELYDDIRKSVTEEMGNANAVK